MKNPKILTFHEAVGRHDASLGHGRPHCVGGSGDEGRGGDLYWLGGSEGTADLPEGHVGHLEHAGHHRVLQHYRAETLLVRAFYEIFHKS